MRASDAEPPIFNPGEFSKITGLTVKTLRFYHDERLLVPASVDPATGYRYYERTQIERARSIAFLRSLDLSVADIRTLLERENSGDFLDILERHRSEVAAKIKHLRNAEKVLANYIAQEQKERTMTAASHDVQEREVAPANYDCRHSHQRGLTPIAAKLSTDCPHLRPRSSNT